MDSQRLLCGKYRLQVILIRCLLGVYKGLFISLAISQNGLQAIDYRLV